MSTASTIRLWIHLYTLLVSRCFYLATHDLSLYYLQVFLNSLYGFLVGLVFFTIPYILDHRLPLLTNGLISIIIVSVFLHIFKCFYLFEMKIRFHHEFANVPHHYRSLLMFPTAWALAHSTVTSIFNFLCFVPAYCMIGAMIGLPSDGFGYLAVLTWLTTLTSESLCELVTELTPSPALSIIVSQGIFMIYSLFADSTFIAAADFPNGWQWLRSFSILWWGGRGLSAEFFDRVTYSCPSSALTPDQSACIAQSMVFPCSSLTPTSCLVPGSTVLSIRSQYSATETVKSDAIWILALLFICHRLATVLLRHYSSSISRVWNSWSIRARLVSFIQSLLHPISKPTRHRSIAAVELSPPPQAVAVDIRSDDRLTSSDPYSVPLNFQELDDESKRSSNSFSFVPAVRDLYLVFKDIKLNLKPGILETVKRSAGAQLVTNISGFAPAGSLVAIAGGSGAGKTTFLNSLSARAPYADISGSVELVEAGGGSMKHRPLDKRDLFYVPQFDNLHPAQSVEQTLQVAYDLMKSSESSGPNQPALRNNKVTEVLELLDLASRRSVLVSELGVGERKRLSVGVGLIASPLVLLLDECTTSLDSESAFILVQYLKRVVRITGVICLMTIHQPSAQVWDLIDYSLLMSKGQTAYFGPAVSALSYFTSQSFTPVMEENSNPADFYLDCMAKSPSQWIQEMSKVEDKQDDEVVSIKHSESKASAEQPPSLAASAASASFSTWNTVFLGSPHYSFLTFHQPLFDAASSPETLCQTLSIESNQPSNPSFLASPPLTGSTSVTQAQATSSTSPSKSRSEWDRFKRLFRVFLAYHLREPALYWFRTLELIITAALLGSIYFRLPRTVAALPSLYGAFFYRFVCVLFATLTSVPTYARDRIIYEDQYLNGFFHSITFHTAHFLATIPFNLMSSLVFSLSLWFTVGFNDSFEAFVYGTLVLTLLMLLMETISLLIVQTLKDGMLSTSLAMVVLGAMMLLPGFWRRTSELPASIRWLPWLVPTRYALEGELYMIFSGHDYESPFGPIPGKSVLESSFAIESGITEPWAYLGILFLFIVSCRFALWALFHWIYQRYQIQRVHKDLND